MIAQLAPIAAAVLGVAVCLGFIAWAMAAVEREGRGVR